MAASSFASLLFFLVLISSGFGLYSASVLKVGDAAGWSIGKIDYGTWASEKTFLVGDTLLFVYDKNLHNVMEVKKADYEGCNPNSDIAILYSTGNDSVRIESEGDHYYLCGVPGHCQAGQKLKITALAKGSTAASSSPPDAASSATPSCPNEGGTSSGNGYSSVPSGSASPGEIIPVLSNAAATCKGLGLAVSALAVAAVSAGVMIMS